jgi:DNA mismatch repair protein MutH
MVHPTLFVPKGAPRDLEELLARARALEGVSLSELMRMGDSPVRTKGKVGEAMERVLGATGVGAMLDFPELGVELKTIPVDTNDKPRESTFVCAVQLTEADREEWETSWVRQKLACVLWLPIVQHENDKTVGRARLWSPTHEQACILQADFEEILGEIAIGGIEGITAHMGRWLQLRPKAADSHARALSLGPDDALIATIPRGFYLRSRFTGAILNDPTSTP